MTLLSGRRPQPFVFVFSCLASALLSCSETETGSLEPRSRPHVVLLIIDTLRADHLPTYGYARSTAPNIDALAKRAWVFDRALAQSGWTLPATGSILSGLLPTEHGAVRDGRDMRRFGRFDPATPTIAETFSAAGYRTGAVVNNTFLAPDFGFNRGFDHYDYEGATSMQHRSALATVEAGLTWLDSSPTPAFLLIHFMEPHTSYAAKEAFHGHFGKNESKVPFPFHLEHGKYPFAPRDEARRNAVKTLYDEEILAADEGVGRLVDGLNQRGLTQSTWILITSDHGEELWDHGGFEHGHHLMGELVRVPLIAAGPDTTHRRIRAPVSHVDLHATLVGLSGRSPISATHGIDLAKAIDDPTQLPEDRPIVAEDCLYGTWRSAVTVGMHRLERNHINNSTTLFEIDSYGQSDRAIENPEAKTTIAKLDAVMKRLRKGREAPKIEHSAKALNLDAAKLEQLRALGYVR